jgi:hypothetical protein
MLIGASCFYKRWVVPDVIENGINGYSSKVKDFKDLGIKIKMIWIIKNWIKNLLQEVEILF